MVRVGLGFAVLFLLLSGPWTHSAATYAQLLRGELRVLLAWVSGTGTVEVNALADPRHPAADLEILLSGPAGSPADAPRSVRGIRLSSRSLAWMPAAMILALTLATPLDWRRRALLAIAGLCGVNLQAILSVLLVVALARQAESTPAWQRGLVQAGHQLLVANLWASFIGPVLWWLLLLLMLGSRLRPTAHQR